MLLTIGLFFSFLVLLLLFTLSGTYSVSPATKGIDAVRQQLKERLTKGHRATRLAVLSKHSKEVVNTAFLIGGGIGVVSLLFGWILVGPWAFIIAIFGFIGGMLLTDVLIQNEYKQAQARLFEGIPALINFMPAFLEIGSITPREAMQHTLSFLPEPLKSEMWSVCDRIARTGNAKEAFNSLANRAQHPAIDAICFRLSSAWDTRVNTDIFADLSDQVDEIKEMAATRATTAKSGFLAVVLLMGLFTSMLVIGYPGAMWIVHQMGTQFN
ncbi:MAG: hypothetical protein C4575_01980 [Desulforudis sp.]|nr:MAG: hypothetical protein C4575_01980 [Desulforudis sp.]